MSREKALIEWLGNVIQVEGLELEDVKDPKYFHKLLQ